MKELIPTRGRQGREKNTGRFRQLWEQAEACAAETELLESNLDRLVARVDKQILPLERETGTLIRQVLVRQLDFSERKTLRNWQRVELEHRVADLACELVEMGLLDATLHERLSVRLAANLGIPLDETSELSAAEQMDRYLDHELARSFAPAWDGPEEAGGIDEQGRTTGPVGSSAAACPDDSVFKRLFRQATAALHPDKENDSSKQAEKHELMKQLLRARKERDLITLLSLHERYAATDSTLSSADEQQLEVVLLEHLENLHERREQIIHKSAAHCMAFHRFHDDTQAIVDQSITRHVTRCKERKRALLVFINEINSLKDYKAYLKETSHKMTLSKT